MSRVGRIRSFGRLGFACLREQLRRPEAFCRRIVLLSYPRSGSSWIGEVLSKSPNAVYLREPVTQPYLRVYGGRHAMVNLRENKRADLLQGMLRTLAFNNATIDLPGNIKTPVAGERKLPGNPVLLIKEVNPWAAHAYCHESDVNVFLLLRHPAAVAHSFSRLGWLTAADTQMTPPGIESPDEWARFGYAYGSIMASALREIRSSQHGQITIYEDLASDPISAFDALFERCGLEKPDDYAGLMKEYTQARSTSADKHETRRDSKSTATKWARELEPQAVASIRRGYEASTLQYYRSDQDWNPTELRAGTPTD